MVFSSLIFILGFLPIALLGFWVSSKISADFAKGWLCLASLVFYGWWHPAWVPVLLISIFFNYYIGRLLRSTENQQHKNYILFFGVAGDLLALFYYKYFFTVFNFLKIGSLFGATLDPIILPIGISFFTFTQIAFLVDVSQGFVSEYRLLNYFLFVTFFPHLIVGPIIHHKDLMPQFEEKKNYHIQARELAIGLSLFCFGLIKKTLIADTMGSISHTTLSQEHVDLLGAWLGVLTYSMQLYFDFSGYSDMAIGLARMFGIRFPLNFNSPYKAKNIIEFWQRWHITLTHFLTAYIYNPMALAIAHRRAAAGKLITRRTTQTLSGFAEVIALPTMTTMLLAGIWHGAGLQFIVFGLLHGFYITINHAWRNFRPEKLPKGSFPPTPFYARLASGVLVYLSVVVGQIFFRAPSVHSAVKLLGSLVGLHGVNLPGHLTIWLGHHDWLTAHHIGSIDQPYLHGFLLLIPVAFLVWFMPNTQEMLSDYDPALRMPPLKQKPFIRWHISLSWAFIMGLIFALGLFCIHDDQPFIYFQF